MASLQARPPRLSTVAPPSTCPLSASLRATGIPLARRSTPTTSPTRRSSPTLPLRTPTNLSPIRTTASQSPPTSASSLSPIPEHSPLSFASGSPSSRINSPRSPFDIIWDVAPFFGLAEAEARRRRESLEVAVWGAKVFRPAGVAGKGTHRRAEALPRPQPPAPKFKEFHLRTEVKGAATQAEVARQRAEREEVLRLRANVFKARPVPKSLKKGPPVELTRISPTRRAALAGKAAGAVAAKPFRH